jgi:serine/threonine protein phosphatase PrpC
MEQRWWVLAQENRVYLAHVGDAVHLPTSFERTVASLQLTDDHTVAAVGLPMGWTAINTATQHARVGRALTRGAGHEADGPTWTMREEKR